jgi:hypothetical protein
MEQWPRRTRRWQAHTTLPLAAARISPSGGVQLVPPAPDISLIEGDPLVVCIPDWLEEELRISGFSMVQVG